MNNVRELRPLSEPSVEVRVWDENGQWRWYVKTPESTIAGARSRELDAYRDATDEMNEFRARWEAHDQPPEAA